MKNSPLSVFNYVSIQIADYRGWLLRPYNVTFFLKNVEELLVSNFSSQTLNLVKVHSPSSEREVYRLIVHMQDERPRTWNSARHLPTEEVYIKRYRVVTWKQHIQTLFHAHKAQKSWRIAQKLLKKGIYTPLPIAYLTCQTPIEHILITQGVQGLSLSDYVHRYVQTNPSFIYEKLSLPEKRTLIRSVAEFLGKLHAEGVYHGDFTAKNILVEDLRRAPRGTPNTDDLTENSSPPLAGGVRGGGPEQSETPGKNGTSSALQNSSSPPPHLPHQGGGLPPQERTAHEQFRIYLIDLDAIRSTHWISDRRGIKNLDELGRNFLDLRVISTTDRARFLQRYLRINTAETRTLHQLFRGVLQRTQKRLRKDRKQFSPSRQQNPFCRPSHWNLHVFPRWDNTFCNLEEVFTLLANPEEIIQENSRGVVSLIRHNNITFVAKRSKLQEHKRWTQFTSVYRKGEAARTLRNMSKLHSLGLPVPDPVLVLEKKRYGFVVASWSLYRYLGGHPCHCEQAPLVAETLKKIHQTGWVHRDPHVKNFLLHENHIYIIDCARARPWRSRYAQMYDVVLLNNCCPGSLKYYGIAESYWVYRLAKFHNNLIELWRKIKCRIRRNAQRA